MALNYAAQQQNIPRGEPTQEAKEPDKQSTLHDPHPQESDQQELDQQEPDQQEPEQVAQQLAALNQRLRLMIQVTSWVVGAVTLPEQIRELARQIRFAFEADACVIRSLDGSELVLLANDGIPAAICAARLPAGSGIAAEVLATRRPLVISDVRYHPATAPDIGKLPNMPEYLAYAGAPLLVDDHLLGILGIYSHQPRAFNATDVEHLNLLAYHVAVAIANDQLYRQMTHQKEQVEQHKEQLEKEVAERQRAERALWQSLGQLHRGLEGTVRAMSSVVEMRDPYTAGHQRRVSALTCAIATELGIDDKAIEVLRMAGLLHDIGKIAVPAEILCKPTRLLPAELSIIQTHAQVGYDILKDAALPPEVALVALQHHERLDGSGYPAGVKKDDICFEAQLLAVADVVEAMISYRPYRPGLPLQIALQEIIQHRSTRYREEAVEACLCVLKQFEYDLEPLIRHWEA